MDGWMDGWMDGDEVINEWVYRQMGGQMDK